MDEGCSVKVVGKTLQAAGAGARPSFSTVYRVRAGAAVWVWSV